MQGRGQDVENFSKKLCVYAPCKLERMWKTSSSSRRPRPGSQGEEIVDIQLDSAPIILLSLPLLFGGMGAILGTLQVNSLYTEYISSLLLATPGPVHPAGVSGLRW